MVGGFVYIGWQINLNPKQVWGGFIGRGFSSRDGVVGGLTDGAPQCAFGGIESVYRLELFATFNE
tara:strand:+ start:607 stop:801 length:195 start_codon:yes stop_codon:yes gene_type:complete